MTSALIGQYQPGTSPLHRLPVGVKVACLGVTSIAVVAIRSVWWALGFLALALVAAGLARLRWLPVLTQLRGVLLIASAIAAFQWWLNGPERAAESLLDLVTLALIAITVMATTPVATLQDAVVRWARPLPFVDADRLALLLTLTLQALPGSIQIARETRDAVAARGLGRDPRHFLAPYVVRVVARAHLSGEALAARGLGDD